MILKLYVFTVVISFTTIKMVPVLAKALEWTKEVEHISDNMYIQCI